MADPRASRIVIYEINLISITVVFVSGCEENLANLMVFNEKFLPFLEKLFKVFDKRNLYLVSISY
jgi:hypothetical protein